MAFCDGSEKGSRRASQSSLRAIWGHGVAGSSPARRTTDKGDTMKRVIIESPYAGDVDRNIKYLRACMRDCLLRGEAPMASHGLYTQPGVLDDYNAVERALGIQAGFVWRLLSDYTVVYTDLGISNGMRCGVRHAEAFGLEIRYRKIGEGWGHLCGR